MFFFRADGNSIVGGGHIMRCLSLADAFRDMGQTIVFITADDHFQAIIHRRGYESISLHTKYDAIEDELTALIPLLQKSRPSCVLLDSYFVTPGYMSAIHQECSIVYIDDLNAFDYPADLVVNYTLYGDKLPYPQNKHYLLGPQYALLRKEFQNVPVRRAAEQVRNVLLSTGGADFEHVALRCVQYLQKQPTSSVTYHVVLGAMNPDAMEIEKLATECPYIMTHRNVSDMRSLMMQCDAAISAGGTTLFELCACGTPTVTYVLADNQIMNTASFEAAGLVLNAGDIRKNGHLVKCIFSQLDRLKKDWTLRRLVAERMQALVDGNGAVRLAKEILSATRCGFL